MKHFENRKEQIWFQMTIQCNCLNNMRLLARTNCNYKKKDIFSGSGIDNAVLYNLFHITQKSIE